MSKLIDYVFFLGLALMLVDATSLGQFKSFPNTVGTFGILLVTAAFLARIVYAVFSAGALAARGVTSLQTGTPHDGNDVDRRMGL